LPQRDHIRDNQGGCQHGEGQGAWIVSRSGQIVLPIGRPSHPRKVPGISPAQPEGPLPLRPTPETPRARGSTTIAPLRAARRPLLFARLPLISALNGWSASNWKAGSFQILPNRAGLVVVPVMPLLYRTAERTGNCFRKAEESGCDCYEFLGHELLLAITHFRPGSQPRLVRRSWPLSDRGR